MPNFDFEELKAIEQKKNIANKKSDKAKSGNQKDVQDAILARLDAIEATL